MATKQSKKQPHTKKTTMRKRKISIAKKPSTMKKASAKGKAPASKRESTFEYCKKRMTPYRPPPLPSSPDRCFFIAPDRHVEGLSDAGVSFSLASQTQKDKRSGLSIEWKPSSNAGSGVGLLDLPREIRDLVYREVCSELKREGLRWWATAPYTPGNTFEKPKEHTTQNQHPRQLVQRPTVFADCAIMRACRQVHAEFAETLYSMPFHIDGMYLSCPGRRRLPFSPLYAGLVRSVFLARTCLNDCDDGKSWREQLHMATSLASNFPKASVVRLGWYATSAPNDPATRLGRDRAAWDSMVKDTERAIKTIVKVSVDSLHVPHNLEVVQLKGLGGNGRSFPNQYSEVESLETPITEVIKNLRGKLDGTVQRSKRLRGRREI